MTRFAFILVLMFLTLCSCKTKYIETIHYEPVEVHDTVHSVTHVRDSITLHDSVYIHERNDTVLVEKWHTQYKWKTKLDTQYISREVPYIVTDTICTIKEVPVYKIVYKQHWWEKMFCGIGVASLLGLLLTIIIKYKR